MAKQEKKRNFATVTLCVPEEKMQALRFYLEEKGSSLERELERVCLHLYDHKVPANVRRFLNSMQKSEPEKQPEIEPEQSEEATENAVVYEPKTAQINTQNHDWGR